MEAYDTLIQTIALTMGVAWASGINLYGTLLALGVMSSMGYVDLPPDLVLRQRQRRPSLPPNR